MKIYGLGAAIESIFTNGQFHNSLLFYSVRVYRVICYKTGFHAVCHIGTMPRLIEIETWFFGIIDCTLFSYTGKR